MRVARLADQIQSQEYYVEDGDLLLNLAGATRALKESTTEQKQKFNHLVSNLGTGGHSPTTPFSPATNYHAYTTFLAYMERIIAEEMEGPEWFSDWYASSPKYYTQPWLLCQAIMATYTGDDAIRMTRRKHFWEGHERRVRGMVRVIAQDFDVKNLLQFPGNLQTNLISPANNKTAKMKPLLQATIARDSEYGDGFFPQTTLSFGISPALEYATENEYPANEQEFYDRIIAPLPDKNDQALTVLLFGQMRNPSYMKIERSQFFHPLMMPNNTWDADMEPSAVNRLFFSYLFLLADRFSSTVGMNGYFTQTVPPLVFRQVGSPKGGMKDHSILERPLGTETPASRIPQYRAIAGFKEGDSMQLYHYGGEYTLSLPSVGDYDVFELLAEDVPWEGNEPLLKRARTDDTIGEGKLIASFKKLDVKSKQAVLDYFS